MPAFELAVQDLEGIGIAVRVGADRLELCAALAGGGVTPSAALIEAAVAAPVPVHVLVRPREGDFSYTADERALIVRDIASALAAGAAGVVVGGARDGAVDVPLMRAVTDAAGPAEVTFHRAFDTLGDLPAALDVLADLGVTRVLTSGGADTAPAALPMLAELARRAAGRIEVMAGGGVTAATAAAVAATGVSAVHASAKRELGGAGVVLGSRGASMRESTDEAAARAIRDAVAGVSER